MAALLKWIFLLPVAIISVMLAIANRQPVELAFDPFGAPDLRISAPLFIIVFASIMIGVVLGGGGVLGRLGPGALDGGRIDDGFHLSGFFDGGFGGDGFVDGGLGGDRYIHVQLRGDRLIDVRLRHDGLRGDGFRERGFLAARRFVRRVVDLRLLDSDVCR